MPCPVCTFENAPEAALCEMCGAGLDDEKIARSLAAGGGALESKVADTEGDEALAQAIHTGLMIEAEEAFARRAHRGSSDEESKDLIAALEVDKEIKEEFIREDEEHVKKVMFSCPHCAVPIYVAPGEINCTIFICGVRRAFDHAVKSSQVSQHNEAAAAALQAQGELIGCGKQSKWTPNEGAGVLVPCAGL